MHVICIYFDIVPNVLSLDTPQTQSECPVRVLKSADSCMLLGNDEHQTVFTAWRGAISKESGVTGSAADDDVEE